MPSQKEPTRFEDLERAIDGVVESYDGTEEINNLDSAALPNKRAVIEAFNHMKHVLYMGFYATHSLQRANLRQAVAEHMYAAHAVLADQIGRALNYEDWIGQGARKLPAGSGEDVVIRLFDAIPRIRQLLNRDVLAAFHGDPAAKSVEEVVFSYPSIEAITAYRVAHELRAAHVPMIPRIITEDAHARTGIDLNPSAKIGQYFFIDHGTGVVVGETTVIGDHVKLYQGVTLGAMSVPERGECPDKRHPTLEDEVTVYSGATILGGDTIIGKGSVIGGNVWLTKSVPPGSKVFGRSRDNGD